MCYKILYGNITVYEKIYDINKDDYTQSLNRILCKVIILSV